MVDCEVGKYVVIVRSGCVDVSLGVFVAHVDCVRNGVLRSYSRDNNWQFFRSSLQRRHRRSFVDVDMVHIDHFPLLRLVSNYRATVVLRFGSIGKPNGPFYVLTVFGLERLSDHFANAIQGWEVPIVLFSHEYEFV